MLHVECAPSKASPTELLGHSSANKLVAYAHILPEIVLLATVRAEKNQCLLELLRLRDGPTEMMPRVHGTSSSSSSSSWSELPAAVRAAFRVPRAMQVLSHDEGIITALELVVEKKMKMSNTTSSSTNNNNKNNNNNRTSLGHDVGSMDVEHVHLLLGTDKGTVFVCNALRGTILMLAQFAGYDGATRPRSAITRFVAKHTRGQDGLHGIYVMHDDGGVVVLTRQVLDVCVEVCAHRQDGDRPHLATASWWRREANHLGERVLFPVAGPAAHAALHIRTLHDLRRGGEGGFNPTEAMRMMMEAVLGDAQQAQHAQRRVVRDAAVVASANRHTPVGLVLGETDATTDVIVVCGDAPSLAAYVVAEEQWQMASAVKAVAAKVVRAVSTAALAWLGVGGSGRRSSSSNNNNNNSTSGDGAASGPPSLNQRQYSPTTEFFDASISVSSMAVSANHAWAVLFCASTRQVMWLNMVSHIMCHSMSMEEASVVEMDLIECEQDGTRMLLLLLHLPERGLLRLYALRWKRYVAEVEVPPHAILLRPAAGNNNNNNNTGVALLLCRNGDLLKVEWAMTEPSSKEDARGTTTHDDDVVGVNVRAKDPTEIVLRVWQLRLPTWKEEMKMMPVDADGTPPPPLPPPAEVMKSFATYVRQCAAACRIIDCRFGPRETDAVRMAIKTNINAIIHSVILNNNSTNNAKAMNDATYFSNITPAQARHLIAQRGRLVLSYARLRRLRANNTRIVSPTLPVAWMMEDVASDYVTSDGDAVQHVWSEAMEKMRAHVDASTHRALQDLLLALQTPASPTSNNTSSHHHHHHHNNNNMPTLAHKTDDVMSVEAFLSWHHLGHEDLHPRMCETSADADDVRARLGALLFDQHGWSVATVQLNVLMELGWQRPELARCVVRWLAARTHADWHGFCRQTSLGSVMALISAISLDHFVAAVEHTWIPLVACTANNDDAQQQQQQQECATTTPGVLMSLLMVCALRLYSVAETFVVPPSMKLMMSQLLMLYELCMNVPQDSSPTPTSSTCYVDGTGCGLRLCELLPRTTPHADTITALLGRRATPVWQEHWRRIHLSADYVKLEQLTTIATMLNESSAWCHNNNTSTSSSSSVFCTNFPWTLSGTWSYTTFDALRLQPLHLMWDDDDLNSSTRSSDAHTPLSSSRGSPRTRWEVLHRCALLLTTMSVLQEMLRPLVEESLWFVQEESVPQRENFFISARRAPTSTMSAWAMAPRGAEEYLRCVVATAELILMMLEHLLGRCEERSRVVLIQALSCCLAEDDERTSPDVPSVLRGQMKVLMHMLIQKPSTPAHRVAEVLSMARLMLFLLETQQRGALAADDADDDDDDHARAKTSERLLRFTVPWSELYGPLAHTFLLLPTSLEMEMASNNNSNNNIGSGDELGAAPALHNRANYGDGDAFVHQRKMRAAATLMRNFFMTCILHESDRQDERLAPLDGPTSATLATLESPDTRVLLKQLSAALGLAAGAADVVSLILVDFFMKHLCSTDRIRAELIYVHDAGLVARVAAINFRVFFVACHRHYAEMENQQQQQQQQRKQQQRRSSASPSTNTNPTTPVEGKMSTIMPMISPACRQWLRDNQQQQQQLCVRGTPQEMNRYELIHSSTWVTPREEGEMARRVAARLALPRHHAIHEELLALLFLLGELTCAGLEGLPPEVQRIAHELPKLAFYLQELPC